LADERGVPAYIIFSDVSLREMARKYPTNSTEFRHIPGVGEQKLKDFGEAFLSEIRSHLAANPRRTFSEDGDVPGLKRPARLIKNDRQ
jgi:ATP-dependent DNA helicase RecQ